MKNRNINKKSNFLSWLLLASPIFLVVFFVIPGGSLADGKIIINEVQIQGENGEAYFDFIELKNIGNEKENLRGYRLVKRTKEGTNDSSLKSWTSDEYIESGEYYVWACNKSEYHSLIAADTSTSSYIAEDNGVALRKGPINSGEIIDTLGWGKCANDFCKKLLLDNPKKGESMGRDEDKNNFLIFNNPTPGYKNEMMKVIIVKDEEVTLRINEIFPNPSQKGEENEFLEIYNYGYKEIPLKNVILRDRNKKECPLDIFADSLESGKYLIVENKKNDKCKITVHNSKGEFELCVKDNCDKSSIYKVSFSESAKTDASFNFYNEKKWRWSIFLTPGKENIFNNLPEEKKTSIPKEAYTNIYAEFFVRVADADGDKVKVTWDFGDGHKSYKAETRHKYEKQGKYKGNLKISDGSEDVIKEFTIRVEDYPERKARIVAINANPVGKDTEGESITVLNKSKKKINLNGWSVATGVSSKKLSNHPINDDLEIKPGKTGEITRDICALTLNNKKGVVELRYPGGEVTHDIKYKKENKESIEEGEVYEKKGEKWVWTQGQKSIKSIKSVKQDDGESNLQLEIFNSDDNNSEANGILPEDVGKKSEIEIENKLEENPYLESTLLPSKPSVLGITTVRAVESSYHFTPETTPEEHYAISFLRKISISLNALFNKAINYFI